MTLHDYNCHYFLKQRASGGGKVGAVCRFTRSGTVLFVFGGQRRRLQRWSPTVLVGVVAVRGAREVLLPRVEDKGDR